LFFASLGMSDDPLVEAQEDPGVEWSQLASDRPLAGFDALDSGEGRMILMGGEAGIDVRPLAMREYRVSGGDWADLMGSGEVPEPALTGRGMVGARGIVDKEEGVALLVCDCAGGSTYLLDLASGAWSQVETNSELPYWYPALVYDAQGDRAILYGGDLKGTNFLSKEVWAFDLSAARRGWEALPDAPFTLLHQAYAVDPASGHLIFVGGHDEDGNASSAAWRVDLATIDQADAWEPVNLPAGGMAPGQRLGASFVFEDEAGAGWLFGGYSADGGGARDLDDLWRIEYRENGAGLWSLVQAQGETPPSRATHGAIWDSEAGRMLMYGGTRIDSGGFVYLEDLWSLGPATGPVATPSPSQTPREPTPTAEEPDPEPRIYLPFALNRSSLEG
jgi:hypothetical protein